MAERPPATDRSATEAATPGASRHPRREGSMDEKVKAVLDAYDEMIRA